MADYNVNLTKEHALKEKMARLGVRESDIVESFIRSSGPGGQNVNKVSTAVYLKHIPTGIEVKCGQERSQALNRFLARRILVNKIETMILGKASEERRKIEKIRRQKRKRLLCSRGSVLPLTQRYAQPGKLTGMQNATKDPAPIEVTAVFSRPI